MAEDEDKRKREWLSKAINHYNNYEYRKIKGA